MTDQLIISWSDHVSPWWVRNDLCGCYGYQNDHEARLILMTVTMSHIDDVIAKLWRHSWIFYIGEFVSKITSFCPHFSRFLTYSDSDLQILLSLPVIWPFPVCQKHQNMPNTGINRSELLSGIRLSGQLIGHFRIFFFFRRNKIPTEIWWNSPLVNISSQFWETRGKNLQVRRWLFVEIQYLFWSYLTLNDPERPQMTSDELVVTNPSK